jgi:hypothetical protein
MRMRFCLASSDADQEALALSMGLLPLAVEKIWKDQRVRSFVLAV